MLKRLIGAMVALASTHLQADEARWQLYGTEPDRAHVSWHKDDFVRLPNGVFELTEKRQFFRPEPIPGGNSLPPASTVYTRYVINCTTGRLQPVNARFMDAEGTEIARMDEKGPVNQAEANGGRTRDRLFVSFCTAMKNNPGPRRLP